jgi:hypothetical protein
MSLLVLGSWLVQEELELELELPIGKTSPFSTIAGDSV